MRYSLTRETLQGILRNSDVRSLTREQLVELVRKEPGLEEFRPEGLCQIDPRTGDRILFNAARARRPHENAAAKGAEPVEEDPNAAPSFISLGKTTGVVDVADLSEGFTLINLNLFPVLFPSERTGDGISVESVGNGAPSAEPLPVEGCHFLQWTSSYQDRDWHNMPLDDCAVVVERLGALENTLLGDDPRQGTPGYISLIKNCGRLVGGSIAHGHQQIAFSSVLPRRNRDLVAFSENYGTPFSKFMLENNPSSLLLRDYGSAALVVPYFMRRPFDMMLILKDHSKRYLQELSQRERRDVAQGWQDGIRGMRAALAGLDRQIAYNIVANTGPGAGMSFDFLPYTQETGGLEHLGLYVCQGVPEAAATFLRKIMNDPAAEN